MSDESRGARLLFESYTDFQRGGLTTHPLIANVWSPAPVMGKTWLLEAAVIARNRRYANAFLTEERLMAGNTRVARLIDPCALLLAWFGTNPVLTDVRSIAAAVLEAGLTYAAFVSRTLGTNPAITDVRSIAAAVLEARLTHAAFVSRMLSTNPVLTDVRSIAAAVLEARLTYAAFVSRMLGTNPVLTDVRSIAAAVLEAGFSKIALVRPVISVSTSQQNPAEDEKRYEEQTPSRMPHQVVAGSTRKEQPWPAGCLRQQRAKASFIPSRTAYV